MAWKRKNKYNAKRVVVDGITFDSMAEHKRFSELSLLQRAGLISCLSVHIKFPIKVKDLHVCSFISDFTYVDAKTGKPIIEDVKARPTYTPLSRLKHKLVRACYPDAELRIVGLR